MPAIKPQNPWGREAGSGGRSLEPQRADLWVLRFDQFISYVTEIKNSGAQYGSQLTANSQSLLNAFSAMVPYYDAAVYYATAVELPELRVASQAITRETRPYNIPAYDEAPGATRITFIHDVEDGEYTGSRVDALLRIWRGLVRTGRGEMSGQDFAVPLGAFGSGLVPRYAFDIKVELYKGSKDGEGVDYSAGYVIKNAWLQGFQVGALRYSGASQVLEITATLLADDVVTDTSV